MITSVNFFLYRKKFTNVITWELYGFPNKFPTVRENTTKPMVWGKSGKLVLILFPWYGCSFPLDSHPMAYFVIWEMHGFSHQFPVVQENATKLIVIWRTWEIGAHTFPTLWTLFFHYIPILWYTSTHGKCMCFLINFL